MLGGMPTGKWSSWRADPFPRVLGSIVAVALMAAGLCRCGSEISAFPLSSASGADAGDDGVAPIVVVVSPFDGAAGGDGAQGDTGDGGNVGCDPSRDPKDAPCLVADSFGVFVSAAAAANGVGTKASPVKSINAGISLALSEADGGVPKRVYVCAHRYDETIVIDPSHDNVRVLGGFRCTDWTYSGELPSITPSTPGVPLTLTSLTSALFADIEIDAPGAPSTPPAVGSTAGASSIAVIANGATGIEFRRAKIVAGNGQPGAPGVLTPYSYPTATDLLGNPADGGAGGPAKAHTCAGGLVTTGGKGGNTPGGTATPGFRRLTEEPAARALNASDSRLAVVPVQAHSARPTRPVLRRLELS